MNGGNLRKSFKGRGCEWVGGGWGGGCHCNNWLTCWCSVCVFSLSVDSCVWTEDLLLVNLLQSSQPDCVPRFDVVHHRENTQDHQFRPDCTLFQISCKEINSQPARTISALSDLELNLAVMAPSGADTSAKAKHFLPPDLDYYLDLHQIPQTDRSLRHKCVSFYD